jgi:hypothetical protein
MQEQAQDVGREMAKLTVSSIWRMGQRGWQTFRRRRARSRTEEEKKVTTTSLGFITRRGWPQGDPLAQRGHVEVGAGTRTRLEDHRRPSAASRRWQGWFWKIYEIATVFELKITFKFSKEVENLQK